MKIIRAFVAAILVWVLGVGVFTVSYFVPLMEDLELQSNIALAIFLIPFAWLGANIYYRKDRKTPGITVGAIMVSIAIVLDGIITVPVMIIPNGGSYLSFFTAPSFWIIAFEYLLVIVIYWHIRVKPSSIQT